LRVSIDANKLGELADDIAANGLHQAIGLHGPDPEGLYTIIYGHRRFLAYQLLQRAAIEAKLYPADVDILQAAVAENEQREQLTPYEQALIVERYTARGEPRPAIARYLRRSETWVRDRQAILTWPTALQESVHRGDLPLAVAQALADIDNPDYLTSLIDEATRTGASARVVDVWRAHYLADRERIITNRLTVADIAERRDQWKIVVACDLCREDQDYQHTRSMRICTPCQDALTALIEQQAQLEAQPGAGS
jgi:ParB/RepB/Spo0J family partition protein